MVTVIVAVVSPVLHNKEPVKPEADNTELPQLLVTVTVGASGVVLGAALPLPGALIQPSVVWVTEYIPAVRTVMDALVSPVLHNNEPVKLEAVNKELSQLLTTVTVGAPGIVFGEAIPVPGELLQPFTD